MAIGFTVDLYILVKDPKTPKFYWKSEKNSSFHKMVCSYSESNFWHLYWFGPSLQEHSAWSRSSTLQEQT